MYANNNNIIQEYNFYTDENKFDYDDILNYDSSYINLVSRDFNHLQNFHLSDTFITISLCIIVYVLSNW
jgi:hypothetical protein